MVKARPIQPNQRRQRHEDIRGRQFVRRIDIHQTTQSKFAIRRGADAHGGRVGLAEDHRPGVVVGADGPRVNLIGRVGGHGIDVGGTGADARWSDH